ncbi:hypothetical protein LOAG_18299 [Loa loa]|uniref:Uncharacterized protein n=1 Tax=Loa loa TaxID=7209 RepID=A0A1S0UFC1_LOALO|nr:hypothetical protein LOAG_18299 [Loa loa]EJD74380.1 hypothetical protein LOAG_18299 [Loa loa]
MTSSNAVENTVIDNFGGEDFDAISYVRDQLKEMKTGDEIRQLQAFCTRLNAINAQSSESVKKSVFLNYKKFIDTAREVSRYVSS